MAFPGGDGIVKDPGVILRFEGQVALALHKAAQVSGLDLTADIPQGTDAVEKRVLFMGDASDLVFCVHDSFTPLHHRRCSSTPQRRQDRVLVPFSGSAVSFHRWPLASQIIIVSRHFRASAEASSRSCSIGGTGSPCAQ